MIILVFLFKLFYYVLPHNKSSESNHSSKLLTSKVNVGHQEFCSIQFCKVYLRVGPLLINWSFIAICCISVHQLHFSIFNLTFLNLQTTKRYFKLIGKDHYSCQNYNDGYDSESTVLFPPLFSALYEHNTCSQVEIPACSFYDFYDFNF